MQNSPTRKLVASFTDVQVLFPETLVWPVDLSVLECLMVTCGMVVCLDGLARFLQDSQQVLSKLWEALRCFEPLSEKSGLLEETMRTHESVADAETKDAIIQQKNRIGKFRTNAILRKICLRKLKVVLTDGHSLRSVPCDDQDLGQVECPRSCLFLEATTAVLKRILASSLYRQPTALLKAFTSFALQQRSEGVLGCSSEVGSNDISAYRIHGKPLASLNTKDMQSVQFLADGILIEGLAVTGVRKMSLWSRQGEVLLLVARNQGKSLRLVFSQEHHRLISLIINHCYV